MEVRRFNHILGFKSQNGNPIGFHSANLEVAELSIEAWESIVNPEADVEAAEQISAWDQEKSMEVQSEILKDRIQSLSINVTQLCNLHCLYCAAGGDGTYGSPQKRISVEKTIPQLKIILDRLEVGDLFNLTFLGGEPLLYPEGMRLLAAYVQERAQEKQLNVNFNTITNGTLFNDETLAALRSFRSRITLSLDGPAEINDVVRPTKSKKSSTELVLSGLKLLLANRQDLGPIGVQGVFGPYNSDPLKAYLFYRDLGVDSYDFHFDQESSDERASQEFTDKMNEVARIAFETEGEEGLRKIKFFSQLFFQLDHKKRVENFCGSGKSYVVLDAKNQAFTCPWAVNDPSESVGSGTDLQPNRLQPLKNSLISTNNCSECWAKYLCGGGCMWAHKKATGDRHKVDRVYCDRTRALISMGISYYYQIRKVENEDQNHSKNSH